MPVDKNKLIRFQALDRCFGDRSKHYYIDALISECRQALERADVQTPDVSRRTIYNDIHEMEGNPKWNVQFVEPGKDGRNRYYQYEDPSYSIFSNDLNATELTQLQTMLLMLKQFKGLPQYERLEEMIDNLQEKYGFVLPDTEEKIAFDSNDLLRGLEHLAPLCMAIVQKQVLEITYQPYGSAETTETAHPYYLKQYNNRWFLFARIHTSKGDFLKNFSLDRIICFETSQKDFIENDQWDMEDYFADIIGVSNESDKVETIVLEFSQHRLPYVLSKPLHESQNNRRRAEGIVEIRVRPNRELYQRLLSYGNDVEVLSPESVRQHMKEEIAKMNRKYE